jgi:hypothetical protein
MLNNVKNRRRHSTHRNENHGLCWTHEKLPLLPSAATTIVSWTSLMRPSKKWPVRQRSMI